MLLDSICESKYITLIQLINVQNWNCSNHRTFNCIINFSSELEIFDRNEAQISIGTLSTIELIPIGLVCADKYIHYIRNRTKTESMIQSIKARSLIRLSDESNQSYNVLCLVHRVNKYKKHLMRCSKQRSIFMCASNKSSGTGTTNINKFSRLSCQRSQM